MVSESGLDLQRRDRSGPPRNLAPSDFFHVPAKPRQYRNSVPYLAAHGKCSRSRRLNRPKSSSDRDKVFVPLPRRWIVERTIAWLNRCRRLAKDWENLNRNALAFLKLASIRLMLRKLCNP